MMTKQRRDAAGTTTFGGRRKVAEPPGMGGGVGAVSESAEQSRVAIASEASSGDTSLSMLDRVRAEDPEAWKRLVELYSPLIYSWARRPGLRNEDAADLLQEVWRAVAGNFGRFRREPGQGSFRGWLW